MRDAALFLFWHSLRNRLHGLVGRLRSPRYALALLLGIGYLGLVLFGQRHGSRGALPAPAAAIGGSVLLMFLVMKWWVFGADRTALAFSQAEIQFLFPAPVSRSALLQYKVLRAQPLLLVNVLVWTFLLHRGEGYPLGPLLYGISLWIFFNIVFLHRLGVALSRDTLAQHGSAGLRRSWPAALIVAGIGVVLWLTWRRLEAGGWPAQHGGVLVLLRTALATAPLSYLAMPFRLPLAPLEAASRAAWLGSALMALGLLGLHLLWVIRADRAFEEAAVEASVRRAERLDRWRRQGSSATLPPRRTRYWIRLAPSGNPIFAIVWKNVTRLVRTLSPGFLLTLLAVGVAGVGFGVVRGQGDPAVLRMLGMLAMTWVVVLALLGPQWVRIDLRGELEYLSMLRTWPLSGMAVMTGQVLSSVVVLTGLELVLGAIALVGLWADATPYLSPLQLAVLLIPVGMIVVALNVLALGIQNAGALLYPAWVRTEIRPGGIEQVGQHLLTAGVALLLLLLAALGPAMAASGLGYLLWPSLKEWALVPASLLAGFGLFLEGFLLLDWLGGRFERADPSAA